MRQTGRSSRIIDFVIDQLFSVGQVIVTDHIVFEYDKITQKQLTHFIDRVERRFKLACQDTIILKADIIRVKEFYVVHFYTRRKE